MALVKLGFRGPNGTGWDPPDPERRYFVADTFGDLPATGLRKGDLGLVIDEATIYSASDATTWAAIGGGGGGGATNLEGLTDVDLTSPANGDALMFDNGTSLWENRPIALADISGHSKAAHDALGIDADTLDGIDSTGFAAAAHTHTLDGLSDVNTTGAADNDALLYDAGTASWVPGVVSGGAGADITDGIALLDIAPATAHASDDDFGGGALDAKWTNPATTTRTNAITVGAGWLRLEPSTAGSGSTGSRGGYGIRQDSPAGSFQIAAKITELLSIVGGTDEAATRCGIFVARTATTKLHHFGLIGRADLYAGASDNYSESADWGAYDGFSAGISIPGGQLPVWVRIRWDAAGTTLYFDYSIDGVFWRNVTSRAGQGQPDRMGIVLWDNSAIIQADHGIGVDWFRCVESATF